MRTSGVYLCQSVISIAIRKTTQNGPEIINKLRATKYELKIPHTNEKLI